MKFRNILALTMCVVFSLTACSPKKTSEEYIQSAKTHVSNGNKSAAIVELKNAVLIDLHDPESRLILGTLYLEVGDIKAAEKELTRSLELNGDKELILPRLFKSLNLQNKSLEIISLFNSSEKLSDDVLPEILLYKVLAHIKLDENEKAKNTIAQANEISSESVYSQLGQAYIKAGSTDLDGALSNIDNVLIKSPELTEALVLKGQLMSSKGDYQGAILAFKEFYRLIPTNIQIRLFLANSYIRNEQFEEAEEHLDFLLRLVPEHPFVNQLKGLTFYRKSNFEKSLAHTDKAIQNGLNVPSNRIIAGLSAFKLEQYERAHHYLITIEESLSAVHPVRKVLAVVQLQLGYSSEAGDTLTEMDGATAEDISLLTTASFELLKEGKAQEVRTLIKKTENVNITNSQDMTSIGILKLSLNDLEGMADLEKALEIDPDLPMAKLALATAYIKNGELDKALSLAEKWKHEKPEEVSGFDLAAKILLLQKKTIAAEVELKHALTINENSEYSLLYFAHKAFADKDPKSTIELLNKLLDTSPHNIMALTLNYRAYKEINNTNIAVDKIQKAYSKNQQNSSYRLLYSRVLYIENHFEDVIRLLKQTDGSQSIPYLQWALLSSSYKKTNNYDKALAVYNEWIKAQPQLRDAWLRKISTLEHLDDYSGALSSVETVLLKSPEDSQFKILRAHFLILTSQYMKAQIEIDKLDDEQKALPLVKGLQGRLLYTEGKYNEALSGLEGQYELLPTPYNAALLFSTYTKLKKEQTALEFMENHIESYPDDMAARNLLAEVAISVDLVMAKKHYLILLTESPDNLLIVNNLAWVEYNLTNYKLADGYALRALELNMEHPQVLDTAGLIKLKLGDKKKAIELLNKARLLAPNNKEIDKHYREAIAQ